MIGSQDQIDTGTQEQMRRIRDFLRACDSPAAASSAASQDDLDLPSAEGV